MNYQESDLISVIEAVDKHLKNVHTQSLDLSFNELLDMYKQGELDISPDYQRLFQWSEGTRSRFIESLLLEMPIPAIYVIEEQEGKYLLIDGLQRISSYLHLRGELEAPHLEPEIKMGKKLVLTDCDIVKELNGKTFDDLGTALQIRLKRSFVRVEVVRKGSDPKFKYHMFKRFNTGGALLTDQQLRNCTIRLLNPQFNDFIIRLSQQDIFQQCVTENLTQTQILGAFDQELVLRFFAFKNYRDNFQHDVRDFLTEYMEAVSAQKMSFDFSQEKVCFQKTFQVLLTTLPENTFGRANKNKEKLMKSFSVYHFEAFTVGLQSSLDYIDINNNEMMEKLSEILLNIKFDQEFIDLTTGGGKNSMGPLTNRIEFVQTRVEQLYGVSQTSSRAGS